MEAQLVYFISYFIESLIAYIYFSENYDKKYKTVITLAFGAMIYASGFLINFLFSNSVLLNLILFFAINFCYSFVLFKNTNIKKSLFHSAVLLAVMFSSEMIVDSTMSSILNVNFDEYRSSLSFMVAYAIFSKTLYLLICKLLATLFSFKKIKETNSRMDLVLFIYPIISTIFLIMYYYTSVIYGFSTGLNIIFIVISTASLLLSCLLFIINREISSKEYELIHLKNEKEKSETDKTFYELLEKKNESQRLLVHDIKHHISALSSIENLVEIKEYLNNIQNGLKEYEFIGRSHNKMLDLLLSRYSYECDSLKIKFIADIRGSNLSFIDDTDLVTLLSNLLDNAIEASKKAPDPFIEFTTNNDKSFVSVKVVNSSVEAPKHSGDKLLTTKSDSLLHGFGIKSIEKTVKKYNGISEWNYSYKEKSFCYTMLFNKNNN